MTDVKDGKLSDITPDANNANLGTQRGLGMLESSLRKHGAGRSILLDRQGRIIAGNKTVEQAGQIGLDELIIVKTDGKQLVAVQREDLDLADDSTGARALAYADNRVGELDLSWNPETILADLDTVDLSGLFREDELSEILGELGKEPQEDPGPQVDKAAELQEKWGTSLGQIWELGEHRLACGDCTDKAVVKAAMRGEKVEMVWTDPPYGIDLDTDYSKLKGTDKSPNALGYEYAPVIGDDKPFDFTPFSNMDCKEQFWWGADYYAQQLPNGGSWFVWLKRNEADKEMIGNDFELCWSKQRHKRRAIRIRWVGWDATERNEKRIHPTQKPIPLAEYFIDNYSKDNYIIYDPFLGSGTTLIACEQLGRKARGIEIDPGYVAVTLERWHTMTGKDPVLTNA